MMPNNPALRLVMVLIVILVIVGLVLSSVRFGG